MTARLTYAELKTETKERRRNAALRDPARTRDRIHDIVMRAANLNPVSVADLQRCNDFARHCLMLGADDREAVEAVRKFIQQINGRAVS